MNAKLITVSVAVRMARFRRTRPMSLESDLASRGGRAERPPCLMPSARLGRETSKKRVARDGIRKKTIRMARMPTMWTTIGG